MVGRMRVGRMRVGGMRVVGMLRGIVGMVVGEMGRVGMRG